MGAEAEWMGRRQLDGTGWGGVGRKLTEMGSLARNSSHVAV